MRSTKSFFNPAIFKKTITRFWPLWIAYLLLWLLIMPFSVNSTLSNAIRYGTAIDNESLLSTCMYTGIIVSLIACCISAMLVFSWMFNSRSAYAYSALPVRRENMYTSVCLAGIVPLIICNIISFAVSLIVAFSYGFNLFTPLLQCFGMLCLFCLFFYGLASFCAVLTGQVFVLPAIYLIFNFFVVVVEYLSKTLFSTFIYGMENSDIKLAFLSPTYKLFTNIRSSILPNIYSFSGWLYPLVYALVGIFLAFAALFIFRKRNMETASDIVSIKCLKPVFKYCMCFGSALVLGIFIFFIIFGSANNISSHQVPFFICLCMIIGGFIGYFVAEMLLKKSFRVFKKSWLGFVISAAVIVIFILCLKFDAFGYERYVPDTENVRQATITVSGDSTTLTSTENIAALCEIHKGIIDNKDYNNDVMDHYYLDSHNYLYSVNLSYTLKNGRHVSRQYQLITGDDNSNLFEQLDALCNSPEAILSRLSAIDPGSISDCYIDSYGSDDSDAVYNGSVQLTGAEAAELFTQCILPDAAEGTIGIIEFPNSQVKTQNLSCSIQFETRVSTAGRGYNYSYFSISPTADSYRTNEFLTAHGIKLPVEAE